MTLSPIAMVLLGLLLAAWTVAAAWAVLWARGRERRAEAAQRHVRRLGRMVDESPALPLLVRADGKIEAPQRLKAVMAGELAAAGRALSKAQS